VTTLLEQALDAKLCRKSPAVRRTVALGAQAVAHCTLSLRAKDCGIPQPVLVNSIPKSGTHLALQIARTLPGTHYVGRFVAERPSLSLKQRNKDQIRRRLLAIEAGEVAAAHVHYHNFAEQALRISHAIHLFIRRDPAEIVRSEIHYLGTMAWHHRMSARFRRAGPLEALELAIFGAPDRPDLYPAFADRIAPFLGWLDHSNVLQISFESLRDPARQREEIGRMAWFLKARGLDPGRNWVDAAMKGIQPAASHTFSDRQRGKGPPFTERQLAALMPVRRALGYREPCP